VPVKINYIRKEVLRQNIYWVVAKASNTILAHPLSIKIVVSNILLKRSCMWITPTLPERLISSINHPEVNYFQLT